MKTIKSKSVKETKEFAKKLAAKFINGGIIALSGDLGSGKTTFAQGFAQGLKIEDKIISPTFLIIRQYKIPGRENFFYHIDLYRLENIDLKNSGLEEILKEPSSVVLIEWSEKLGEDLPENAARIKLRKLSEELHEIKLSFRSASWRRGIY